MPEALLKAERDRRQGRRNAWIVAVLTVVAVSAALILNLPWFYYLRSDCRAMETFLRNLDAGRYGDAYAVISPEMQARTDYPAMVRQQEGIASRLGRLQSVNVRHLDSHGSRSRRITNLRVHVVYERGATDYQFLLLESYGRWTVWSFEPVS
ncbi:hypothetical protein [Occallatibacter riparius]|uniref:DUF4878 domain-containing protein n=1 Tax=Occallatibacter riparius TaxID=1002689 RepID=A0A9J7BUE0_9BACT|nr:hypothetical protein [Occallatibacter riparius]UWZ86492.1 hypothetical protein MOP44_11225 [Occallatibacter riparius]